VHISDSLPLRLVRLVKSFFCVANILGWALTTRHDRYCPTRLTPLYQQSGYDQCLFHAWRNANGPIDPSQRPDDQHDDFMFIGFHVDDFLIVTTDKQ